MAETLSIIPEGEVARIARREIPTPSPASDLELQTEERKEYAVICEQLGIVDCTDLIREKLKSVLRDENIHIYDLKQVVKYLDQELGNDWEWRGLRPCDVEHLKGWHTTMVRKVPFSDEPYRGAVPLPVLMTVKKIVEAVPEMHFYVSTPKGDDGDPFLNVTRRNMGSYIVERWDEPNFRER
jgi:hypothetical protein